MRIVAVIPARMGSSRYPGKPLASICGRPMIEHVFRRTRRSRSITEVYIATCDQEIADAAAAFGAPAVMTSSAHERASDRVAEVAASVDADVYVMVQGDEPMIRPDMLDLAVAPMIADPAVLCVNLIAPIRSIEEFRDPNTIKVVKAANGNALYFSRAPMPGLERRPFGQIPAWKQVCVIPFRREFLATYQALPPTPLEIVESVDMLRILEHGYDVRLVESFEETYAVDTPEDLARVEAAMQRDAFWLADEGRPRA